MRRRALSSALGLLLALGLASTALADSCANVSRAPAACGFTCDHVVVEGNWVWLPSLSNVGEFGLPPFWGFAPPGAIDSQLLGTPGQNGNYQDGFSSSLLGHSAYCLKGVNRTTKSHGVVSGCE
jgi:hypothetical protein